MKNYEKFCSDFIDAIYKEYDKNDFKYDPLNKDLTSVLAEYVSIFTTKFVVDKPRTVHISSELQTKMNRDFDLKDKVDFVIEKIKNGGDINGHLTRQIYDTTANDDLYSDWGIKHIHLNKTEANTNEEMRLNRSGDLLFAIFELKDCYLIDAKAHNVPCVFALMEYLKIIVNNWPDLCLTLNENVSCINLVKTNEDIKKFRKSNVNTTCYEIDGVKYMKIRAAGLTMAGTDLNCQIIAMKLVKEYESIDDEYKNIDFNFLNNDFGTINCKNNCYYLGVLYPQSSK